jgi:hypothetical protein
MSARSAERAEFLSDIIVAAVEGGTGYWAQVSQYQVASYSPVKADARVIVGTMHPPIGTDTRAVLHPLKDDDSGYEREGQVVDIEKVATSVVKFNRGEVKVNLGLARVIWEASSENDAGMIDAEAADVIVQVALFGEVVFG